MPVSQIVTYSLITLILFYAVKRILLVRSVTQYSVLEARSKVKGLNTVLVDVRTAAERKDGFIKGSIHIPLHEIKTSVELNKLKGKEIICYCRSGSRSISAASILKKKGFNAGSLLGGYSAWNH